MPSNGPWRYRDDNAVADDVDADADSDVADGDFYLWNVFFVADIVLGTE